MAISPRNVSGFAFALGLAFLSTFVHRVESLIGGRVLFGSLIGRYHTPTREERVFMFLDIADPTRLSEQFGDVKIQALTRACEEDSTKAGDIRRIARTHALAGWCSGRGHGGTRIVRKGASDPCLRIARSIRK